MCGFLLGLLEPNIGFGSIFPIWEITTKTQENPTNFLFFSHFGNHQKFPVNNIPYFNSTVVCFREYKDGGFFNRGGSGFFIFSLQTSRQNVDPVVGGGGGGGAGRCK